MDPLIIFLVTGLVSMSAALSASALNKLAEEDKPAFLTTRNGMVAVVMAGNVAAITLLFSAAYGFYNLDWWIPLLCILITFPVIHLVVVQPMLGEFKALILSSILTLAAIPTLYYFW